MHFRKK